jgi:uncharacterized protein YjbI with pentapeptide repeats
MRTLKPLALTVLRAPFQHNGKVRLVIAVGAMVSLDGTKIEQEQTLWKALGNTPGSTGALDEVRPKVRGEALAAGYAFAPGGTPVAVVAARLAVGPIRKELWVVGDRAWRATGPSDPVPFDKMPLDYEHAFGGDNYAQNPKGKGFSATKTETNDLVHLLPNVELAKKLVTSPRDRPQPGGFAPIDPSWPQRIKKTGTYDKKWLDTKYPEMADDLDPTYFNVAPDDQWIEGYWQGGEAFALENMHPQKPRLEGVVPNLTARVFVSRKGAPDNWLEDVALRCDTLWFFPHLERMIMIFRGGIDAADEEGSDITDMLASLERKDRPRSLEHYRRIRGLRLDKSGGALYALRDSDLIPEDIAVVKSSELSDMDSLLTREKLPQRNMRVRAQRELDAARERLRAAGVDPDKHLPKEVPAGQKPPEPDEVPQLVEDMKARAEKAQSDAAQKQKSALAQVAEICKANGINLDDKVAAAKRASGGPPKLNADAQIARLKSMVEKAKSMGAAVPAGASQIDDPALLAGMRMAEKSAKGMYRRSAHLAPVAEVLGEADAARVRRDVEASLAAGVSLAERDLTGADLSGLDFSGRDLSGAFLEKANLAACVFRDANVESTVFARANLTGADFHGARVKAANFGEADLTRAKLTGDLDLSEAIFVRATLTEADLSGAKLDRAQLSEAKFERTNLARITADSLFMMKSDLRGVDLREAKLLGCNFLEVDLSGADLTGATLTKTTLLDVTVEGACFKGAKLDKLRVVKAEKGSTLARSTFRGASMRGANLRGVNLEGVDLRETDLTGSDFSEANLRGANLEGARAPEIRLVKADLTDANLDRADLMHALMGGAIVRGASFEEANVFRADAAKMKGDDKTSFKGANVKQVRTVPDRSGNG